MPTWLSRSGIIVHLEVRTEDMDSAKAVIASLSRDRKWRAQLRPVSSASGKYEHLGLYDTEKEAAKAFDNSGKFKAGYDEGRWNKHRFPEDFPKDLEAGTVESTMSEYQGVSFIKARAKKGLPPYRANVSKESSTTGKWTHVGYFESEVEAARAFDESPFLKRGSASWKKRNILKYPDLY